MPQSARLSAGGRGAIAIWAMPKCLCFPKLCEFIKIGKTSVFLIMDLLSPDHEEGKVGFHL